MSNLFNTVLPMKVYGIFDGHLKLGEVTAENVHEAFSEGRRIYGDRVGAAICEGKTQREPMFLKS